MLTAKDLKFIRTNILNEGQQAFAERLGYTSFVNISRKENGKQTISRKDEIMLKEFIPLIPTNEQEKPPEPPHWVKYLNEKT